MRSCETRLAVRLATGPSASASRTFDVDLAGEHGHADRADLHDLFAEQRQHEVEIVNHEIEQHVDVERARDEDAEALGFEIAGAADESRDRLNRGVVALDVADLDDATLRGR